MRLHGAGLAVLALVATMLGLPGVGPAVAQLPPPPPLQGTGPAPAAGQSATTGLDAIKIQLDAIELTFKDDAQSEDELIGLKRRVTSLHDDLRDRDAQLEPRLKTVDQRIVQIGAPPEGAATEDAAISTERTRLAAEFADIEGALKQVKLMADRAGDVEDRINDRRRELFASRMFGRGPGLVDTRFWNDLLQAIPAELSALGRLTDAWAAYAGRNGGAGGVLASLAILAGLCAAAWFVARWVRNFMSRPVPRRFDKALSAVLILAAHVSVVPVLIVSAVLVLRNFGLMSDQVVEIGLGIAAAVAMMGFGRGVAEALFSPGDESRRIVSLTDREAATYASHLIWATRVFGFAAALNAIHRGVGAPVAPLIATEELRALAIMAITFHLLWRSAQADFGAEGTETKRSGFAWFRGVFWLIGGAIGVAIATGYVGLAAFLAGRMLATVTVVGAAVVLMRFVDALLTDLLASDTPHGRRVAALFGLSPRGLDLVETLAAATLKLVLLGVAALVVMAYSGIFADDILGAFRRVTGGLAIGGVRLSPVGILSAVALFAAGVLGTRAIQRWLQTKFLPRTAMDVGLQSSISALFGYVALFAIISLALGTLGIDLQKIALIAGALSVGIGFGLQSVVSNFVCGLILLAERPIRVGDWVVVKNEEGWVRRISVRATEIETFDRAAVIIPNQEFITGVVKNWTHGNTVGRLGVKVRVSYESDPDEVRQTLLACAAAHPQILKLPSPQVLLVGFVDIGIEFELRCFLGNVEQSLPVKSDLQMDILRRFGAAGIKIPFPIHDARPPGRSGGAASPAVS